MQESLSQRYDVSDLYIDDIYNMLVMFHKSDYEEEDEYCPHCDNHYVLEAVTPEATLGIETEDIRVDNR